MANAARFIFWSIVGGALGLLILVLFFGLLVVSNGGLQQ